MKNKKGFAGDWLLYLVMIFVLALSILIIYYLVTTINTAWQATPNLPSESTSIMSRFTNRFAGVWDAFFLFLIIGFAMVTIILAYALRSAPVFAGLTIFLLIIMGMLGVYFANAYYDVAKTAPFNTLTQDFTMLHWLAQRLPHIVIVFGILFVIILYAKTRSQGLQI